MSKVEFFAKLRACLLAAAASACALASVLALRYFSVGGGALPLLSVSVVFSREPPMDEAAAVESLRAAVSDLIAPGNLSEVDISEIMRRASAVGWVKDVAVRRRYPGAVEIFVEPRRIIAYLYRDGAYFPVDDSGGIVDMHADHVSGLVISGAGAAENIVPFLSLLEKYPRVYADVAALQYVNGLRWNVVLYSLDGGVVLKLPEDGAADALERIGAMDGSHGILRRALSEIDARDPAMLLARPAEGK